MTTYVSGVVGVWAAPMSLWSESRNRLEEEFRLIVEQGNRGLDGDNVSLTASSGHWLWMVWVIAQPAAQRMG